MMRVLVVEDSRTQALAIRLLLEEEGCTVALAGNGREALSALKAASNGDAGAFPNVILTDLDMPEVNGLELVEAVRHDYPGLPVVLVTAMGSEEIAVRALAQGAASYVPKKNLDRDIIPTLTNVVSIAEGGRNEQRLRECLTRTEICFELDNDPDLVPPLIGHLEEQAACLQRQGRNERMRVGVALHEAMLNAIYHGNLEVSSDLRQEDERHFTNLVSERRQQSPYRDRRVFVRACLGRNEAVYVVEDQGRGFDPSRLPDPTDPTNLGRIGGRGLMLIRTFMDHVAHNATGNEITMVKRHTQSP
jgi:CheY-like chemotaxis protein